MGMFDNPDNFVDHFKENEPFQLEAIRLGPVVPTEFGDAQLILLTIGGKDYSIIGQGIASQVARMSPNDLPARVKVSRGQTKAGRPIKLIIPADHKMDDDIPF